MNEGDNTIKVKKSIIEDSLILCLRVIKIADKVPRFIFNPQKDPEFNQIFELKKELIKILKKNKDEKTSK